MTDKIILATPLDKGDLRKSLTTEHATLENKEFVWVSKGNIAPYNLKVHELPNDTTNWSEPGTGNKYLERPVNNHAEKLFTKAIREGLKANGF